MKAVFLDYATVDARDLDDQPLRAAVSELTSWPATSAAELDERIAGHDVVLLNKVHLDAATLARHPDLKLICLAATGSDNIDLSAAREHGVAVCNIRDYCTASVAQHVFALILTLVRNLDGLRLLTARGAWHDSGQFCLLDLPIRDLSDMTLGIVGYGALGQAVAKVGEAFGMQVLVAALRDDSPRGRVPLQDLLGRVDVLSLHVPLTDETRGLVGAAELARMKADAILINTARGGLLDSAALAAALRRGELAGAGIDVLPHEPPASDEP